jgi:osmotically inducible lipoprotein OsmB
MKKIITVSAIVTFCLALGACSSMQPRDRNVAAGAVVGGVLGSVLTDGSALGTVGGAAVGGLVGNSVNRR